MSKAIRSARGDLVNFELLAIKSQLASVPVPKNVEDRKTVIEEYEGVKPVDSPAVNEMLKAAASTKTTPKRK